MADDIQIARAAVIALAREQLDCHYVWGGAGNSPDRKDGAWYRVEAVHLHADAPEKPRPGQGDSGRIQPIVHAAYCRVDGYKVCAGMANRDWVKALPKGDPKDPAQVGAFASYRWPRPGGTIDSTEVVWGEACEGTRHFDCIGFINWCLSVALNNFSVWYSIPSLLTLPALKQADAEAGDILTIGNHHIGFATGDAKAVHAMDTRDGVVETTLAGRGWDRCGRLPWAQLLKARSK